MRNSKEQPQPQALDLEEAVLGAIMIEQNILNKVIGIVEPDDFYKDIHQIIFSAILDLDQAGKPIDILTVSNALETTGNLKEVGGPAHIAELSSKTSTAAHIVGHALIVKEKSVQRKYINLANDLIKSAYDSDDIANLISLVNDRQDEITESLFQSDGISYQDAMKESLREAEQRQKLSQKGEYSGITTPLVVLNQITNGFQKGELVVLAGRPSMGKTALALAIAKKAALAGERVLLFSLEMKGVRLTDRALIGESGVDPDNFKSGKLSEQDWNELEKAQERLSTAGIYLYDTSGINLDFIRSRSRIMKKKDRCGMVIIDYLGLIDSKHNKNMNREQEVAEISKRSKALAMELDIPVILLSQLNRSCELRADKRPNLSDLRESGAIEQDADLVGLIFRAEHYEIFEYDDGVSTKNIGELNIAKNRNGKTKTIKFKYNKSMTQIYDMEPPGIVIPQEEISFKDRQFSDS